MTHRNANEHVDELVARAERLKRQSSAPPPPPMSPPLAAAHIQQAVILRSEGRLEEATASLTEATTSPRFAVYALRLRSEIEEQQGRRGDAIGSLKDALHLTTGDADRSASLYREIADLHARRSEPEEAEYYLRRALRLLPDDEDLLSRLAWCEHRKGNADSTTRRTVAPPA